MSTAAAKMSRRTASKSPSSPATTTRPSSSTPPSTSKRPRFTQKDEINLLKSLLPSAAKPFNDRFSQSQVATKTRKLKRAYHKLARTKSLIKTPHDRSVYVLGRQIWGDDDNRDDDEVINWSDYPNLMMEVSRTCPRNEELYKRGLEGLGKQIVKGLEEKWKNVEMDMASVKRKQIDLCCKCFFKSEVFKNNDD